MKIFVGLILSLIFVSSSYAQSDDIVLSVLSSSEANNDVVYTLGDIHIDDTSGVLAAHSFRLFYEESVSVDATLVTNVKVYPNPADNYLTVTSDKVIKTVKIIDVQGREILSSYRGENIDLSNIDAGIYIIIVNDRHTFKITKQ